MSEPAITLYTSNFCGFCVAAKRLLDRHGIPYQEVDLSRDPSLRMDLVAQTGHRTVPIILLEGALVGGYNELVELHRSGGLDRWTTDENKR